MTSARPNRATIVHRVQVEGFWMARTELTGR
jgi:hypothetical protein